MILHLVVSSAGGDPSPQQPRCESQHKHESTLSHAGTDTRSHRLCSHWLNLKSCEEACITFKKTRRCPRGAYCPYRHTIGEKETVCKHWLRGLCKKGDQCDFLHRYERRVFYMKLGIQNFHRHFALVAHPLPIFRTSQVRSVADARVLLLHDVRRVRQRRVYLPSHRPREEESGMSMVCARVLYSRCRLQEQTHEKGEPCLPFLLWDLGEFAMWVLCQFWSIQSHMCSARLRFCVPY